MSTDRDQINFDSSDILPNLVIDDKYRILKKLSKGGMGSVFIAEQISLQRKVAIKVISSSHQEKKKVQNRFFSEATILATLQHPHIVKVIDFGRAKQDFLYLVMELLQGQTLRDYIHDNGELSIESIFSLGIQISSALAECHTKKIIHRDIKPGNIFVQQTADGMFTAKLIDFGLGKTLHLDQETTNPGEVLGSPMYMAPEQIDGGELTTRSDIYSLGLTLYFSAAGKAPFPAQTISEIIHSQLEREPESVFHIRNDVDHNDDIVRIIDRCIEKEPEDRFLDSLSLLRALRKAQRNFPSFTDEPLFTEEIPKNINHFYEESDDHLDGSNTQNLPLVSDKKKKIATGIQIAIGLLILLLVIAAAAMAITAT